MQQQNKRISKIADIGELDRRITLMKKKYVGENPNTGMSMYKDVRLGDVWAKVSALHGHCLLYTSPSPRD